MATYLKRTSKLFDLTMSRASAEVNLRDLMCPVCRGILIEPVTLPCTHNLCLGCLKGTFEHNSLSCPLCRVRVGSWVRTATKSETLVNSALWELIRTRFPKEVEGKHNGDEGDIELDSGFTSKKVILSAAGEIRREYEVQLKIAEEEMRRQRDAERIANEALIRKIQAEEQQQLAQLAQDQLMAKSLAKKQLVSKEKSGTKYYGEYKVSSSTGEEQTRAENRLTSVNNVSSTNSQYPSLHVKKDDLASVKDDVDIPKTNVSIISKIRADRHVPVKARLSSIYKESNNDKAPSQKSLPIHNAVTRTLKHQTIAKYSNPGGSNFVVEPSCSNAPNYGTRIKEELHVPKDVLSSKKKSLGVEVCMTTGEDDERIGSAESAGSHDSINQEIHHFKPIKPMARTALKMSYDGRPIDPKLVRVIPILKRVTNAVPKPPSPTHVKRILGCSWSAFRGKARQNLELRQTFGMTDNETDASVASTSSLHPHQMPGKLLKSQVSDTVRRLDLAPDSSFDSNKNYAKNINRILNGTKVSKRLIMDETVEVAKVSKPAKAQSNKNGTIVKNKRQRNLWNDKKIEAKEERETSSSSPENSETKIPPEAYDDGSCTIENIAERIKRRKVNRENVMIVESEAEPLQRSTRRRARTAKMEVEDSDVAEETPATVPSKRKRNAGKSATRTKRQRTRNAARTDEGSSSDKLDSSIESNNEGAERRKSKRTTRNKGKSSKAKRAKTVEKNARRNESEDESSAEDSERIVGGEKNNCEDAKDDIDEQIIKEQQRIERLVLQEKEDFELALRLQAQFNDMERIAGRTRGSRRAMESNNVAMNASVATKTARINTNSHTANQGNRVRQVTAVNSVEDLRSRR